MRAHVAADMGASRNGERPWCLLDLGGGFGPAVFDRGLERGVVAFVLVGAGFGEVGDGLVEPGRAAQVGGQRDPVPGASGVLIALLAVLGLFFAYYNTQHRHSGIGLHTPQSVHDGTAIAIQARRQQVLDAAYAARPDRFHRPPQAPKLPAKAWINQPPPTIESQEDTAASIHAA
jgi:hypothetical protein